MQPTPAGEVRIKLIDDVEMMAAHQQYCGIGTTTDVLTFDMSDHGIQLPVRPLDVDLFVCVDEARRQGTARQFTVERETLLYCLHGVLHCLGYDDHDETDHDRMHAEEDRLLREIGVGVTFAVNAAEGKHTP